jgi:hypothetical protein
MRLNSIDLRKVSTIAALVFVALSAYAAEPPSPPAGDKTTAPAASSPAPAAPAAKAEPKLSTTAQPRAATSDSARAPARSANSSTAPATRKTNDRLNLDTTVVTGNRELPKVLYIVPWKKADIGDLPAQPFNTLLDEVLAPVDRDVFRREVTYYGAIAKGTEPSAGAAAAPAGPSRSSEK